MSDIKIKKVYRVYDMYNNGIFIKEFQNKNSAVKFAEKHSIFYAIRELEKHYIEFYIERTWL